MRSLIVLASLSIALPATAQEAPKPAKPDKSQRRICRNLGETTGSRMTQNRICKTKAEWDAERAESDRAVDTYQRNDQTQMGRDF